MFSQNIVQIASLFSLVSLSVAIPPTQQDQQPLIFHNSHDNVQTVRKEFKKAEIIPTVIDDFLPSLTLSVTWHYSPKSDSATSWPLDLGSKSNFDSASRSTSKSKTKHAKLGNTIAPKYLSAEPSITIHDITSPSNVEPNRDARDEEDKSNDKKQKLRYVVILTDPDAPSRSNPKWSEVCHWIISDIPITDSSPSSSTNPGPNPRSSTVMPYKAPGPPPKTGKHRYVFLVFAPRNGTTEKLELSKPSERKGWGYGKGKGGVREWAGENGLVVVGGEFVYSEDK